MLTGRGSSAPEAGDGAGKAQHDIVMVTPLLPFDSVPHAGGRYLVALGRAFETAGLSQLMLTPDTPSNRTAATQPGCPDHLIVGPPGGRSWTRRGVRRALAVSSAWFSNLDPGLPDLALATGLRRASVRAYLAGARVVDLQWSDSIRLAGVVRRLAPQARLVGTFHDVQSQLFDREARRVGQAHPAAWRARAAWSRRWEQRAMNLLDEVVVFSDKDADLLPRGRARITVVRPPLAPETAPTHVPPSEPVVVLVSYLAREENQDAARWLMREIWPTVRRSHPTAHLQLVGAGADPETVRVAEAAGAELLGFVDDLDAVYAGATVSVSPLRAGAGVKFKTVESILAGVPVVATPTGAEGVAGPDQLGPLPESAGDFAERLIEVLRDPAAAQERADRLQGWAMHEFSAQTFARQVRAIYG